MKKLHLLILFFCFWGLTTQKSSAQLVSTEGKLFWIGFMDIAANTGGTTQRLLISSKFNTTVTVRIPLAATGAAPWSVASWTQTVSVTAGAVSTVNLPNNSFANLSETIMNKGVFISSLQDISVYAVQVNQARTEGSVVLPVSSFGGNTEYIINTYPATNTTLSGDITNAGSRTEFIVVGMKDDTDIRITPSVTTRNNKTAGVPFDIQLDSGQVYLVQSKGGLEGVNTDLTGTTLTSLGGCKPFSVFSGATALYIPDASCSAWQHLYEQNYPIKTWGKEYILAPFAGNTQGFVYKIIASENNTTVNIKAGSDPVQTVTLQKAGNHAVNVTSATNFAQGICVTSDKPISIAQYMKGQSCNGVSPANGDPSMLILNPLNQTTKRVTFATIPLGGTAGSPEKQYINVLVKNQNTDKIKIQNTPVSVSQFVPVTACTGYSYAMLELANYGASPYTLESDSSFIAYAYGYGNFSAYAYSVGASFENQLYNFATSAPTVCIGTPVTFTGSGVNVTSYTWDFGDGSPTITLTPATPGGTVQTTHLYAAVGTYSVRMTVTTLEGCGSDYIIKPYEILPFPAPALGVDRNICPTTTTVLNPAHSTLTVGSPTYKWYRDNVLLSNTTSATLIVSQAGTYKVEVTNAGGCSGTDEIVIGFHTLPTVDIVGLNTSYCINNPAVTLQGTPAGGTFTVKGAPATTFNPLNTGTGTHRVIYTYTDANTCITRDTLMVTVNPLPVVTLTGLQNEYCATNTRVPLTVTPSGGSFTINGQPHPFNNIKLDSLGAGTYNIVYSFTDANSCTNTTNKSVIINPLPVLDFVGLQNAYCIDAAAFTLSATPAGGTFTVNGTNATNFNPTLLGVGTHTVIYSYTDAKNCSQTKTQNVVVNPLPTPVINLQDAYCKGQGLVTLNATPSGGVFTIDGVVATDFNTVTMDLGEYEVIYTYTDANTCLNRDTLVFDIVPSPIVNITGLQFVYCIDATPFNLTATPHPNNPDGFGIFRINGGTPVTQVTPSVLGAGTHTVEYTYTDTRTNCVVVQTKQFEISGLPSVSLVTIGGLKPTYCLNEAPFSLTGIGTPAGGIFTISGVIRTVFDPVAIGSGQHTVIYNYQDVNGCFNTASTEILIYEGVVPKIPNLKNNYCVQNTAFNLIGEPVGGTFRVDGVLISEPSPLFSPSALGVGEHTIVYKTLNTCDSLVRKVQVYDAPQELDYEGLEMCSFSGDTITLDAGEGIVYEWSNFKTTRIIKVIQSGKYSVTVTDTLGCKTTSEVSIAEKCDPKFFIPTAFTPNGDGLNDKIKMFGQDFYKLDVKIFNRWGEMVYFSTKKEDIWDGTIGGKPAPAGVYVCRVKYLERPNGVEKQFISYINLIR
jgi:gliding motility-associated-like protein